jgi:hypothetical protein
MIVKILKTYRGKHGLFVQGHIYDLTKTQVSVIESDCQERRETFAFEVVKDAENFNKPAKKKQQGTPADKEQTGGKTK